MTRSIYVYIYSDSNERKTICKDYVKKSIVIYKNQSEIEYSYIFQIFDIFITHFLITCVFIAIPTIFIIFLYNHNHNNIIIDNYCTLIFNISFIYIFVFPLYIFYIKYIKNIYLDYKIKYLNCVIFNIYDEINHYYNTYPDNSSDKVYIIGTSKCKSLVFRIAEKLCKENIDVNFKFI